MAVHIDNFALVKINYTPSRDIADIYPLSIEMKFRYSGSGGNLVELASWVDGATNNNHWIRTSVGANLGQGFPETAQRSPTDTEFINSTQQVATGSVGETSFAGIADEDFRTANYHGVFGVGTRNTETTAFDPVPINKPTKFTLGEVSQSTPIIKSAQEMTQVIMRHGDWQRGTGTDGDIDFAITNNGAVGWILDSALDQSGPIEVWLPLFGYFITPHAFTMFGKDEDLTIEDFTTYTTQGEADAQWVSTDVSEVRVDIGANVILHVARADGTADVCGRIMFQSATKGGIIRCKITPLLLTDGAGTDFNESAILMQVGQLVGNGIFSSSDWSGFGVEYDNVGNTFRFKGAWRTSSSVKNETIFTTVPVQGTDYWIEIIHFAPIDFNLQKTITWNLYSDNTFTTLIESKTDDTVTGMQGLIRGIKISNNQEENNASPASITMEYDDIQFVSDTVDFDDSNIVDGYEDQEDWSPNQHTVIWEGNIDRRDANFNGSGQLWPVWDDINYI